MAHDLGQLTLETLLSQAPIPLAATDSNGCLILYSPALQRLTGHPFRSLTADQLVHEHHLFAADGVTPLDTQDVPLMRALRGEIVTQALIATRLSGGDLLFLRCDASPIRDEEGGVAGAMVLIQDATAERIAERTHDELRDRMVETINHELRTPLTKIVGHAELLREMCDGMPPVAAQCVEVISRSTADMLRLADSVSHLADLEVNTKVVKAPADVAGLVRNLVAGSEPSAARRGLTLVCHAPAALSADVDPGRLAKAVGALLDNAVTYAPTGTVVTVAAESNRDHVVLRVADEGCGIPEQDWPRLVHPFERGHHDQQPVSTTGLGLALAHTIAAAHGGELAFTHLEPAGFEVSLHLPGTRRLRGAGADVG